MDSVSCPQCGQENPARAKFCLECGHRLPVEDEPSSLVDVLPQATGVEGERRTVTVLFADLAGFTAYSEGSDIQDVHALADETADKLGEIVVRYGGYVDKVIGDCVMAVFGAPTSHEDDPERAVRAALDMHAHVSENTERFARLQLTIGLNTGEAIWAPVGPGGRHTVLGDTVNTAARLQSAASKGQVLIGEDTARRVSGAIKLEAVEPVRAKNKADPVPAWLAVGLVGAARARTAVRALIRGRDRELARLSEVWTKVREDERPRLVSLIGPAGIGKSAIVEALEASVGADTAVLHGRCLPYGEGITYWPVIEIIKASAGIERDDDREDVSAKLGAFLEGLGSEDMDELRTMAVSLAHLIGVPKTPRGTWTATEISRAELHWGLRRILELSSRQSPLLVVLEDLHHAEQTLLELIAFVTQSAGPAPILAVATGRPEFAAEDLLSEVPEHLVMEIDALDDDESRRLIAELVSDRALPEDAVERLLRDSGGNPLFIEEMARLWTDEGATDHLPDGINAVIAARLDRLPPIEQRVVARAAVIGNVFWSGTVRDLVGGNGEVGRALERLEERDLVRARRTSEIEDEREYEFKHGLLREVAYGRLTKTERVTLHARCSDWITARPGGEEELAEIIAYHLEQACLLARDLAQMSGAPPLLKAVTALTRAAERAQSHEGTREASRFYERALGVMSGELPETEVDVRLRFARTVFDLGRLEEAASEFGTVVATAERVSRFDLACRAHLNLADADLALGMHAEGRGHLAEAERLAAEIRDRRSQVQVRFARAEYLELEEDGADTAIEVLREAVAIAEEIGDAELRLAGHLRFGALLYNVGLLSRAEEEFTRTSKIAAEQGSLLYQAHASRLLVSIGYHVGPREEAESLAHQTLSWMERLGQPLVQSEVLQLLGQFALARDDAVAAEPLLQDALRLANQSTANVVEVCRHLSEATWRLGRTQDARRAAEAAREAASEDDEQLVAFACVAEAFAAGAADDTATAIRRFDEALDLLDDPGLVTDKAEVELAFGRFLVACGDRESAARHLAAARETFLEIGALASVAEIDERVSNLGP